VLAAGGAPVVQVCFHGIGRPGTGVPPADEGYFVPEDLFLATLDLIGATPATPVQLSFDDGYASDVEIALPALARRSLSARFFPVAGYLGRPGYLDARGVRELADTAMIIGSHGMRHRSWRRLGPRERDEELVRARDVLQAAAGHPVESAACPFGAYDRRSLASLRAHGYAQVFTSDRRPARAGAWLQPRYSVRSTDTIESVRDSILRRSHWPQRARAAAAARVKAWR